MPPQGDERELAVEPRLVLDQATAFYGEGLVCAGGTPWRLLRFSEPARAFLDGIRRAGCGGAMVEGEVAVAVARRLIDRGLAHPMPAPVEAGRQLDVEVVVPFHGPGALLEGCLDSLKGERVIVVDDHSEDIGAVERLTAEHGARLERHASNRGPAAARNTGARASGAGLVAFVDADCRPESGWLELLAGHFADPKVAAVAPRIAPAGAARGRLDRYERVHSPLDMGPLPALARAQGRVPYVPSAALVMRREVALEHPFDESLRLGEDVDLAWRLDRAGWLVRYEPRARVEHLSRGGVRAWATRRFEYGTSAGALARRHGDALAPARLSGLGLATILLAGTGRMLPASAVAGVGVVALERRLRGYGVPISGTAAILARGLGTDARSLAALLRREWWPIGCLVLLVGRRRRLGRALIGLLLAPVATGFLRRRPGLGPVAYTALRLLDGAAYGSGVVAGCVGERTLKPLIPAVRLGAFRSPRRLGASSR